MNIAHLLTDEVAHAPRTGVDKNGDPSFGSSTTFRARIEKKRVTSSEIGQQRDVKDVFMTDQPIDNSDIVWLDTADSGDVSKGRYIDEVMKADPLSGGKTVKEVVLQ